jgi:hypothetical protein
MRPARQASPAPYKALSSGNEDLSDTHLRYERFDKGGFADAGSPVTNTT